MSFSIGSPSEYRVQDVILDRAACTLSHRPDDTGSVNDRILALEELRKAPVIDAIADLSADRVFFKELSPLLDQESDVCYWKELLLLASPSHSSHSVD